MADLDIMDVPKPQQILKSLILGLLAYTALVPVWFVCRGDYARIATCTTTTVVLPLLRVPGSVTAQEGRWISLTYTLHDPRTGGWGQVRQRFFDFSDLPLAIAFSLAFPGLGWLRRIAAATASLVCLLLCHLSIVIWTTLRLASILGQIDLSPPMLDVLLTKTAEKGTRFGNFSTVITLGIVVTISTLLRTDRSTPNSSKQNSAS